MTECISCCDDIEVSLFYKDTEDSEWKPCPYCEGCINWFKQNQWNTYVNTIKTETCKKTLKRMIELGPPTRIREPTGLPSDDPSGQIWKLKIGDEIIPANLEGSYEGERMEEYKKELKLYLEQLNDDDNSIQ